MASIPKRHQRSIIPQKRTTQGKFKTKPATPRMPDMASRGILRAQQIPTMLTANDGAIGEQ